MGGIVYPLTVLLFHPCWVACGGCIVLALPAAATGAATGLAVGVCHVFLVGTLALLVAWFGNIFMFLNCTCDRFLGASVAPLSGVCVFIADGCSRL